MALWRRSGFAADSWTFLADDAPVPDGGKFVVSLKRWLAEGETLEARRAPVGVAVEAGADAQAHLADLAGRPLVALAFAKFADGRAFSYARMLRDRFRFKGELRAVGEVLIDEIPLMLRCGFDSFEVSNPPTLSALRAGRLPGPPIHYQPGSVGDETARRVATVAAGIGRRGGANSFGESRDGPPRRSPKIGAGARLEQTPIKLYHSRRRRNDWCVRRIVGAASTRPRRTIS